MESAGGGEGRGDGTAAGGVGDGDGAAGAGVEAGGGAAEARVWFRTLAAQGGRKARRLDGMMNVRLV